MPDPDIFTSPFHRYIPMTHLLFILPLITALLAPGKETFRAYYDEASGWSTEYPDSWHRMSTEEIAEVEGRGLEAVEEAIATELVLSHRNLLWLKKDIFNSFTSNIQLLDADLQGSYASQHEIFKEVILSTYRQQGINHTTTSRKVKIDGIDFSLLEVKLYTPDGKQLIMTQHLYDGLIDPRTMMILNANFNNAADKALQLRIVKKSTFRKRS
jgi:hypothetical protein